MSMLNFHPAPGLGDLLPGEFVVPQNPIRDAGTPLVPSTVAVMGGQPYRIPRMGDLLPGKFVVPQNPIITTLANGYSGIPQQGCGCGCAKGMGGIGDWLGSANNIAGITLPNWAWVGIGFGLGYAMTGHKLKRQRQMMEE